MEAAARAPNARAFSDFVHDFVQLFILRFEELVRLAEVRTFHVPMEVAGLDVKRHLVCQQGIEDVDDRPALTLFESDVDFHLDLLS